MKKISRYNRIFSALFALLFLIQIGGTALAVSDAPEKSATIWEHRIYVNGTPVISFNEKGAQVPAFELSGSTYLPVRSIAALCDVTVCIATAIISNSFYTYHLKNEQTQPAVDEHIADWMHKVTELANCSAQNISYVWNTPNPDSSSDYEFFQAIFSFESASIENAINDAYALATTVKENSSSGLSPNMIILNLAIDEKALNVTLFTSALPEKSELENQILQAYEEDSSTTNPVILALY